MKKLLVPISLCLLIIFFACSKDDDTPTPTPTIPQCAKPTNVLATDITFDSATITWSDSNNAPSFKVEYGLDGFSVGSGISATVTNTTVALTGLMANTTYNVYVEALCSASNTSMNTNVYSFTTAAPLVVPQFLPTLSQLNLFSGDLSDLTPSPYSFKYELNTPLFSDYAHKHRIIALPPGTTMDYVDNLFPNFPDNTVIAKTFFYFNDERDESLGKKIIETRLLIKINGVWEMENYKWNVGQTDANLDTTTEIVPVSYIDESGRTNDISYIIPSAQDCIDCHSNNDVVTPIGPKLRSMNFNNQLQNFIAAGHLANLTDPSTVTVLPNWEDDSYTLEERARAYFDVNCAHCHTEGGYCEVQTLLRLSYETPFVDSYINEAKDDIDIRMQTYNPPYTMPLIGTTIVHDEGYSLIRAYLSTLE